MKRVHIAWRVGFLEEAHLWRRASNFQSTDAWCLAETQPSPPRPSNPPSPTRPGAPAPAPADSTRQPPQVAPAPAPAMTPTQSPPAAPAPAPAQDALPDRAPTPAPSHDDQPLADPCMSGACGPGRYPDFTCPAAFRTPINGPMGHSYYTCPGFAGVFCTPTFEEPGSQPVVGIINGRNTFCDVPYTRQDTSYGVVEEGGYEGSDPSCTTSLDCNPDQFCDKVVVSNQVRFCAVYVRQDRVQAASTTSTT